MREGGAPGAVVSDLGSQRLARALGATRPDALGLLLQVDAVLERAGVPPEGRLFTGSPARLEEARSLALSLVGDEGGAELPEVSLPDADLWAGWIDDCARGGPRGGRSGDASSSDEAEGAASPASTPAASGAGFAVSAAHVMSVLSQTHGEIPEPIQSRIQALLGHGDPLDPAVASRFSGAMAHDFSHVRVHDGGLAAELANSLSARAFTVGADIFFAASAFAPGTQEGDHLLAHELAHVVQADEGRLSAQDGLSSPTDLAEVEAAATAETTLGALEAAGQGEAESTAAMDAPEQAGASKGSAQVSAQGVSAHRQVQAGAAPVYEMSPQYIVPRDWDVEVNSQAGGGGRELELKVTLYQRYLTQNHIDEDSEVARHGVTILERRTGLPFPHGSRHGGRVWINRVNDMVVMATFALTGAQVRQQVGESEYDAWLASYERYQTRLNGMDDQSRSVLGELSGIAPGADSLTREAMDSLSLAGVADRVYVHLLRAEASRRISAAEQSLKQLQLILFNIDATFTALIQLEPTLPPVVEATRAPAEPPACAEGDFMCAVRWSMTHDVDPLGRRARATQYRSAIDESLPRVRVIARQMFGPESAQDNLEQLDARVGQGLRQIESVRASLRNGSLPLHRLDTVIEHVDQLIRSHGGSMSRASRDHTAWDYLAMSAERYKHQADTQEQARADMDMVLLILGIGGALLTGGLLGLVIEAMVFTANVALSVSDLQEGIQLSQANDIRSPEGALTTHTGTEEIVAGTVGLAFSALDARSIGSTARRYFRGTLDERSILRRFLERRSLENLSRTREVEHLAALSDAEAEALLAAARSPEAAPTTALIALYRRVGDVGVRRAWDELFGLQQTLRPPQFGAMPAAPTDLLGRLRYQAGDLGVATGRTVSRGLDRTSEAVRAGRRGVAESLERAGGRVPRPGQTVRRVGSDVAITATQSARAGLDAARTVAELVNATLNGVRTGISTQAASLAAGIEGLTRRLAINAMVGGVHLRMNEQAFTPGAAETGIALLEALAELMVGLNRMAEDLRSLSSKLTDRIPGVPMGWLAEAEEFILKIHRKVQLFHVELGARLDLQADELQSWMQALAQAIRGIAPPEFSGARAWAAQLEAGGRSLQAWSPQGQACREAASELLDVFGRPLLEEAVEAEVQEALEPAASPVTP